ncbi:unnamed protein product [Candidula unifasciata]|uniref:UBX domain-containing protein 11 n=1 Tax=Candidula unifasciata TaxID=100452 RepID=A0A8S3ZWH5_9EUPU|nr:unnamed protein product [Candidula unifasciata]
MKVVCWKKSRLGMVQDRKKHDPFMGVPHLNNSPRKSFQKKLDPSLPGVSVEKKNETKSTPSDYDLMRVMMNKITVLEKQNLTQENELRLKERQIQVLEDKLRIAEKARKDNVNSADIKDLETHCLLLQQQVHEMETFLAEYGMVWVGESLNEHSDVYLEDADHIAESDEQNTFTVTSNRSESSDGSVASSNPFGVWQQDVSLPVVQSSPSLDFNQLVENVKDLNVLAGEGVAQIKKTTDGARFEIPEPVQLTIYANGILMFDGPFRPYNDPATRRCVQDLLDGYFPSELQGRYPDGVPFALTDLRETYFQPTLTPVVFAGEGQTLGGEVKPSRLISTIIRDLTGNIQFPSYEVTTQTAASDDSGRQLMMTSKHPGKIMTQTQFLKKLPKTIIKNGKVIDIRDSVGRTLASSDGSTADACKPNITLINTSVTKEMSESVASSGSATERPGSYKGHGDVTTLRVVTGNGDHTYIVKMKFKETVGDLRTYLDAHRRPAVPYDIVSTFPHKIHNNNILTLEESGLTPNAVLHLKPHK